MINAFQYSTRRAFANTVLKRSVSDRKAVLPLKVTDPAPKWKAMGVLNEEFKTYELSDYSGKFLVMVFYPLNFTFVCPTELIAFSEKKDEFLKRNTHLVGVSCDSHFSHLAWNNQPRKEGGLGGLNFPLISDIKKQISRDYNVLLPEQGISLRGLFIIDDKGILRVTMVNDLPIGRNVEEVLRLVDAIQFTDKHGEVCPANWNKGSSTIKPNVSGSKEYFKNQ
uniref:Peroxiredoxin n=1 Tax=Zea mays TaxID=4577 RepID=B6UCX7_MAIZE|nr:2-cys peroxiredoxin BAS1 [Zea mays]